MSHFRQFLWKARTSVAISWWALSPRPSVGRRLAADGGRHSAFRAASADWRGLWAATTPVAPP